MLQRRVEHVLSCDHSSPAMVSSLAELSTFFDENLVQNRRNLGRIIERRGMEQHVNFIDSFEGITQHLEKLKICINALGASCTNLHQDTLLAKDRAAALVGRTNQLNKQRLIAKDMENIAREFVQNFQLTQEEEDILKSGHVSELFFSAIDRLQVIRDKSKQLLIAYNQKAGLDIMDSMAVMFETSLDALCRSTISSIRTLHDASPEVSPLLIKSVTTLRLRPAYFSHCLQELATIRKTSLLQRFSDALIKGGPNGMPRPIEIHIHDRLRYVSDILAWVHQSIAFEIELSLALLSGESLNQTPERFTHKRLSSPHQPPSSEVSDYLESVFENILLLLQERIHQAIESEVDPDLLFQISTLFTFYRQILGSLLCYNCRLVNDLSALHEKSMSRLLGLLKAQWQSLIASPPSVGLQLKVPDVVNEMLGRLSAMMQTHNSSVTPSEDIFEPVLTSVIDPIFELCAAMTVNRNASESSVLHLNVLTRVQNTLWPFAFASKRNDGLLKLRDEYLQTLIKHQSDSILQRVGLADIQQLSHQFNESEHKDVPLSEMPGMNASSIRNIVKEFYKTLFSLGTIDLPECERLVLPQLRMAARDGVAQALNQSYQSLYCAIKDPKSGYADPDVILEYSPSDVSTLLDTSVNT